MNDTVKLIIEIDPNIIYAIQNNKGLSLGQQIDICNAIKNGIPLEDVKAEIEQLRLHKSRFITSDGRVCVDSQDVLEILDNIGKAESEVKPNE